MARESTGMQSCGEKGDARGSRKAHTAGMASTSQRRRGGSCMYIHAPPPRRLQPQFPASKVGDASFTRSCRLQRSLAGVPHVRPCMLNRTQQPGSTGWHVHCTLLVCGCWAKGSRSGWEGAQPLVPLPMLHSRSKARAALPPSLAVRACVRRGTLMPHPFQENKTQGLDNERIARLGGK